MNIKKSVFLKVIGLVLLLSVVLTGCGGGDAPAGGGDGLNIAIITSPSGVDDGSFNQDNYNGILTFIESNPDASVKAIKESCFPAVIPVIG